MIFNVLSLIMGGGYIVLGIFVRVYGLFTFRIGEETAGILGLLLIFYGVFRIIRAILKIKKYTNAK